MSAADRLDEIQARADNATAGAWETGWDGQEFYVAPVKARGDIFERVAEWTYAIHPGNSIEMDECTTETAEFIAHARTDVPALVAALRAVLAQCDRHESISSFTDYEVGRKYVAGCVRRAIENNLREA